MQVTIGGDTFEKLRLAKDLLRHAVPSGDEAVILDRALTVLLASLAQRKFAATLKRWDLPEPAEPGGPGGLRAAPAAVGGPSSPSSRHIQADVKRTVWLRDLGRCAFVARDGRRCGERGFLEFHHLHPWALGGGATARNIQLRCRAHNHYEGRVAYGRSGLVPERVARGPRGPSP
jgi:hypothetical protein